MLEYIYVYVCEYEGVYMLIYDYMHICMYVHMCIYGCVWKSRGDGAANGKAYGVNCHNR